jgi:PAS domain-containing protein
MSSNSGLRNFEHHATLVIKGQEKEIYLLGSTAIINTSRRKKNSPHTVRYYQPKVAEEALQKSEMFLRTFIDNTPFQIWVRDTRNIGILENRMMQERFGSIIGKKPSDDPNIETETALLWEQMNEMVMHGKMIDEEIENTLKGEKVNYHQLFSGTGKWQKPLQLPVSTLILPTDQISKSTQGIAGALKLSRASSAYSRRRARSACPRNSRRPGTDSGCHKNRSGTFRYEG